MRCRKSILLIFHFSIIIIACCGFSHAGAVNLTHLTVQEGLPNSITYYAMQDSKGFIWFCTETGVSRYDGRKFENFTIKNGLADNVIFKCFEDSKERIWFLSYNGKLSYYHKGRMFNSENLPSLGYPLTGTFLLSCVESKSKIYFSTSRGGVIEVSDSGVKLLPVPFSGGNHNDFYIASRIFIENDSVKKFTVDKANDDLYIFNITGKRFFKIDNREFPQQDSAQPGIHHPGGFIFISQNDLLSYKGNGKIESINIRKYGINSRLLAFMEDGNYLWVASEDEGVTKIDINTHTVSQKLLQGQHVVKIFRDRENNVWFVTYDSGVFVLKYNLQLITTVPTSTTRSVCIVRYNGRRVILCGDNNGNVYTINNGEITSSFRVSTRQFNRILDIVALGGPDVLICSDDGLYKYNVQAAQKPRRRNCMNTYKNFDIAPDSSIWCCSQEMAVKIKGEKCAVISNVPDSAKFTALAVASDSEFYIGTINKLYKLYHNGRSKAVVLDGDVLKTQVTSLKYVDGVLWVATHGNGVFLLKNDTVYKHLSTAGTTIISDICNRLFSGTRYIWLSTDKGISVIEKNTFRIKYNISVDIGLASNDINNVVTDDEQVYAATAGGLSIFRLKDIEFIAPPPLVYINGFRKDADNSIDPGSNVSYNYFKGFINVSFTAITYQSPQNLQYQYKFEDESDWHHTDVTDITFFALQPGTHKLLFRAKKYNSDWSKPAMLSIVVNPLWYQALFARIAFVVILLAGVYLVAYNRIRQIRKKINDETAMLRKITELETKALISQMNPHFIFNCLNTAQQLILTKEERQGLDYLSDFATLMRQILKNSRKQYITLTEEVDFLRQYLQLEAIRYSNKFNYNITIDPSLASDEIKIPPVLLQPLLENAIKHGVASNSTTGCVNLSITREQQFLLAVVDDNGKGINAARKHPALQTSNESTALKVISERIKLIRSSNGDESSMIIKDKSIDGNGTSGTRVELRIPVLT